VHTPTPKVDPERPSPAIDDRPRFLAEIVAPPPFEVRGDMRARVIWALFRERGMAWVPVVDETGHPIGTLLRSELALAFCPEGRPLPAEARDEDEPLIVADLMRSEVRVLRASAPVAEALALLTATSLPAVVVVDHRGIMLGTVSRDTLTPPRRSRSDH
jgi:CBS-domain-containing membrane protein